MSSTKRSTWIWALLVLFLHGALLLWLWFDSTPSKPRLVTSVIEVGLSSSGQTGVTEMPTDFDRNALTSAPASNDASPAAFDHDVVLHTAQAGYFSARELDERPYPQQPVVVPYPDAALGKNYGSVVLLLRIDARGQVQQVSVVRSDVPPAFEKAAIDAFAETIMVPGLRGGQAVGAEIKIAVDFGQP